MLNSLCGRLNLLTERFYFIILLSLARRIALSDVNTVRASRTARPEQTPPAISSIDLDIMFRERGFELYWEGFRRGDQIRFGKFEDTWTEKTSSDVSKRLFPIPQSAIDGASNVEGFLVQNSGF